MNESLWRGSFCIRTDKGKIVCEQTCRVFGAQNKTKKRKLSAALLYIGAWENIFCAN